MSHVDETVSLPRKEAIRRLPAYWAFSYYVAVAWKAVGATINDAKTAEEATRLSGLNWRVESEPVFDRNGALVPFAMAVIRQDSRRVLGVVRKKYVPLQNQNLLEILASALTAYGGAIYRYAGEINNGVTVWGLAEVPCSISEEAHALRSYLLITSSHDGKKKIELSLLLTLGAEDDTTLILKRLRPSFVKRGKHTLGIVPKLSNAKGILLEVESHSLRFGALLKRMQCRTLAPSQANLYFSDCFGLSGGKPQQADDKVTRAAATVSVVKELYGAEHGGRTGTLWDAYKTVCVYIDHVAKIKGKTASGRLESTWFGTLYHLRERSWSAAEKFLLPT